jgi:XTP/dITP diphosphohydrolase
VRSARYAGLNASDVQNLEKLIAEVPEGTGLRYVCALAYVDPGRGIERMFFGECRGRMAPGPRGSRGFGYDPVFVPDELGDGRTMAELDEAEKDAISHRGRAIRALVQWLHP